jgi:hypothetical protein
MGAQVYGLFVKEPFRALNSIKYHTIFKDPGTKHSRVFYLEEKRNVN